MDQATAFVQENSGTLRKVVLAAVLVAILYVVYSYLYPSADPSYTTFLKGDADARKSIQIHGTVPAIYTGGDFTLSMWIYVDDWNYKVSSNKFLFAISPKTLATTSKSPLVGILTPYQNGLLVRANTVVPHSSPAPGSQPPSNNAGPDITVEANLQALLNQQTSINMFQNTLDTPCDLKEVPLQRWVNLTIVSSGRVLDVYADGKLARSCVLENVVNVPRGPLQLRLGENGGFGGSYSSVQMWSQQLTPDVIYSLYQMGPSQSQYNIFTDLTKYLNLGARYTPGEPNGSANTSCSKSAGQMASDLSSDMHSAEKYLMSRF
jgi:hypothetical protein